MKLVFKIASRLRQGAPIPRDFLPLPGHDSLGLVYQGRIIEDPKEFNDIAAQLSDPRFPNRGCQFTAHAIEGQESTPAPKVDAEPEKQQPDEQTPEPEENGPEQSDQPETEEEPAPSDEPAVSFSMDGKSILNNGIRVGGLYGEEKQLRVLSEFLELRPQIEAWLETLNPSDP